METLKLSDLICGEIYYSEGYYGPYIFKFNCLNDSGNYIKFTSCICTKKGNEQLVANYKLDSEQHNNLRKTTTEEKLWLNTCIKENKYLSKEEVLKKTSNYPFEIGKYYQFLATNSNSTQITKCDRIEEGYFESDNWIFCNGPWDKLMSGIWEITLMSDIKELSLEEIQQYLPNEHPDKIKYTQLKVDDWVVVTSLKLNNDDKNYPIGTIAQISNNNFHTQTWTEENSQYWWCWLELNKKLLSHHGITELSLRKATQEEIDSVSKPKELVEEPIKPVIKEYPEYYESVKEKAKSFTKGKIYKIKNPSNLEEGGNFIDDAGMENGFAGINYTHFKPSTKEAFDLQESKSKPITNMSNNKYKIGDIVDTNDEGFQFCDTTTRSENTFSYKSGAYKNQTITNVKYSEVNLNWWYLFENIGNWYTESSIVGLSKEKIKEIPNSSIIEDFQIKCNSEEESNLCEKWAISKGLSCSNSFLYTGNWSYFKVIGRYYIINDTHKDGLLEKTLNYIGITKDIPEVLTHTCTNTVISNSINPESPKYDLSTTISRAINENNPNIIAIESGKSIEKICEGLNDGKCKVTSLQNITNINCVGNSCTGCIFSRHSDTNKATDWLKGIKSTTNPTLKNPIVEEFEITPITISKEPDFTTINSIYDRIPDVEY